MARARRSERPDASLIVSESKSGIFAAAAQILSVSRSTRDLTVALKNPIQEYAAYIAALVFLEDRRPAEQKQRRLLPRNATDPWPEQCRRTDARGSAVGRVGTSWYPGH